MSGYHQSPGPLFDARTPAVTTAYENLDAAFMDFHARNPVVYATLVRLARYAKGRGLRRIGIRMLYERMRWEITVETDTPNAAEPFKLNDHHTARYARLIMLREADLADLFEIREGGHL